MSVSLDRLRTLDNMITEAEKEAAKTDREVSWEDAQPLYAYVRGLVMARRILVEPE